MKPNELASSKEFIAAITKVIEVMRDNNVCVIDTQYMSRKKMDGIYHVQITLPLKDLRVVHVHFNDSECDFWKEFDTCNPK